MAITAGDSLMRAERLPCWLSTPSLRLISRVHRDREERPITSVAVAYNHFLSSLPRPPFAFALFPHTIIYLFIPFSVFLFATLIFFFFLQICREKKTQMALKARSETHKVKDTNSQSTASRGSVSVSLDHSLSSSDNHRRDRPVSEHWTTCR